MIDYIACILVRALNYLFRFIPINASLWLGRCAGNAAFFFNKKRRLVAYANLKAAFAHEKSPGELKSITKRSYQNLVQTFIELLNLTKVNRAYVDRYVEVVNMDRIRNAAISGRGTILLTGHFGDWELSSLVSSVEGYPILVLAREQKMKRLNELLNNLRESNGCTVIRKGISTKNILKALYEKNIVGILSDQDAGKNGMFVDFFGRPASCHSGPFEIAERTNSIILPNFIVRIKGANHKLFLEEYIDSCASSSPEDIKRNLQKFTKLLESYIRKYPDQWLWMHKRWKSTPIRTILVLDDGKAGHLNQSLAVAEHIKNARITQGVEYGDTRVVIVNVKFKNRPAKNILGICAFFANWRCHGCMKCMRILLEKESYDALMRTYSDFVISCGSSLSGVNVLMASENNAKNIVIMKPGAFIGFRKFRLALVPVHDLPPVRNNIIATDLAPNLINEDRIKRDAEVLARRVHIAKDGAVGVFIGGDNPEYALHAALASSVIDCLCAFSKISGADLIITTSRRTSPECEKVFKDRLAREPKCKLLVIANEKNPPETVGGILGLSKVIVVSEESVSMVSEAVASGRPVVVFRLDKKTPRATKHESTLSKLVDAGYVTVIEAADLGIALERAWKSQGSAKVRHIDDNDRIFEAVRRLI